MTRRKDLIRQIAFTYIAFLLLVVFIAGAVMAASWEFRFVTYVTENNSTDRTNLPVMLGFGGNQLLASNKINADGLNTYMGGLRYMMSTANITTFLSSLPANARATIYLYTGYSPEQTGFSIITGSGGYVTTSDHASIEYGGNFTANITDARFETGTAANIFHKPFAISGRTGSDNITVRISDHVTWPLTGTGFQIASDNNTMEYDIVRDATDRRITHDLGSTISDTSWDLDFTWTPQPSDAGGSTNLYWGIWSADSNPNGYAGDAVFMLAGNGDVYLREYDGGVINGSGPISYTSETTYYVTLERIASDNISLSLYTDAGRTTHAAGSPITYAASATVVNLQYVMGANNDDNGSASDNERGYMQDIYIDDVNIPLTVTLTGAVSAGEHDLIVAKESPFFWMAADNASVRPPVIDNLMMNAPLRQSEVSANNSTTIDSNEYTMAINGPTWYLNQGYDFDGIDDYISLGDIDVPGDEMTIEGWAWIADVNISTYTPLLASKGDKWALDIDGGSANDPIRFIVTTTSGATAVTTTSYSRETWLHLAAVYDGAEITIFINGSEVTTPGARTGNIDNDNNPVGIGGDARVLAGRYFDGYIAESRIYSAALTDAQVLQNYDATRSAYTGGDIYTYSTLISVPDNSENWIFFESAATPYVDEFAVSINGTRQLYYKPNVMLIGATLPDRENSNDGTITWGSNTNLSIAYGEMSASESVSAVTSNATGGFDMPSVLIPSTWFASGGNVTALPFYSSVLAVVQQLGFSDDTEGVQTIYFIIIIGISMMAMLLLTRITRSALMGSLAMIIILFVGSSMTVIPMWIPFVVLLIQFGIMFLYRQVTY